MSAPKILGGESGDAGRVLMALGMFGTAIGALTQTTPALAEERMLPA
jgi:hypothetical protein